jgi:hypothetical protein
MGSASSYSQVNTRALASLGAKDAPSHLSKLQKLDGIERLLDIGDFVLQSSHTSLEIGFHELVFPAPPGLL